ncbi:MAG: diacylglycerol kinase family protein [Defluviitaleaceae bacterium]|nr:diacylglycerol kinase family protein [Defluviitaleaceae bacterium]MCL2239115.1 diacylglycerol kinase family protein [Defluviitaleaceae bacterium]
MNTKKNKSWFKAAGHAFTGIRRTATRERNFRIQIIIAIAAVAACIILQVDSWHFLAVVLSIFFVLAMELVNTAVEAVVDLVCKNQPHPLAKIAKDAAAGAVLLASFQAIIVAALVALSVIRRFL